MDNYEQKQIRFHTGFDDGMDGSKQMDNYYTQPEMYEDYLRGFKMGREKLMVAVKRLEAYGFIKLCKE